MSSTTIDLEVQSSNRVYLPRSTRKKLDIKVGDWITVKIIKVEKAEKMEVSAAE